ncbi:MAG: hypothetical protein KDD55_03425 [Bdellovibrionales bacterium]|nr:hypothetical protein [Bdellovibrionales bacterium]
MARIYRFLLLLSVLFIVPGSVLASDLRVIDALGLTRAVMKVSSPQVVHVSFQKNDNLESAVLKSQDGVVPHISGSPAGNSSVVFHNVPAGTWQVQFSLPGGAKNRINKVTIGNVAAK